MIQRTSTTKDSYQESHLDLVFSAWSRGMYLVLALFTGSMSAMVYLQKEQISSTPILGWEGYFLFQALTAGIFIGSVYSVLWALERGQIEQGKVSFSWWGFWIRDFFMALVFFPFAVVIVRLIFSGTGNGLFVDLGGLERLFNSGTPLLQRILLGLMALVIGGVILVIAFIPIWLLWRSLLNLIVQLKHGTTTALFDARVYTPGDTLTVKISSSKRIKSSAPRRIFINYLQKSMRAAPPPSKKGHQRNYLYSQYRDLTVGDLEKGLSFSLPSSINENPAISVHQGADQIRYWEIIVEEPEHLYWARFLFLVE